MILTVAHMQAEIFELRRPANGTIDADVLESREIADIVGQEGRQPNDIILRRLFWKIGSLS